MTETQYWIEFPDFLLRHKTRTDFFGALKTISEGIYVPNFREISKPIDDLCGMIYRIDPEDYPSAATEWADIIVRSSLENDALAGRYVFSDNTERMRYQSHIKNIISKYDKLPTS